MSKESVLHIEEGKIANKVHMRRLFDGLEDGIYLVTIKPRKRRSQKQNAYYHAVVCDMVREGLQEAGYGAVKDAEDAHEILKSLFLKTRIINEESGEVLVEMVQSTTKLTTTEFEEYLEKIRQWAAEYLGVYIPEPGKQGAFKHFQ